MFSRIRSPIINSLNASRLMASIACNDINMIKISINNKNFKYDYTSHINNLELEYQKKLIKHDIELAKHIKKLDESIQLDLINKNIMNIYHFNITNKNVINEAKSINAELKYDIEEMISKLDEKSCVIIENNIPDNVYIDLVKSNPNIIKNIKNPSFELLNICNNICNNIDKEIKLHEKQIKFYHCDFRHFHIVKRYFNSPKRVVGGVVASLFFTGLIINYPFGTLFTTIVGSIALL